MMTIEEKLDKILSLLEQLAAPIEEKKKVVVEQSWQSQAQNDWPKSVSDDLICNHLVEGQKVQRASDILDIIVVYGIKDKFLDFGCGDNYSLNEAKKRGASLVVGYDIKEYPGVCNDWEQVKKQGPYETVLLYDVLDHCEEPNKVMQKVAEVTTEESKIYVTTHPWLSRHGGHSYTKINKAFVHLFSTETNEIYCNRVLSNFGTYQKIFNDNDLFISEYNIRSDKVDNYFLTNPDALKHLKELAVKLKWSFPQLIWTMRHSFYDFILTKQPGRKTGIYPVATCHHVSDNVNHYFNTLYSDGKVYSDFKQIPNNASGFWSIEDRKLLMKWPTEDNAEKFWIDTCNLDEDLQSYSGSNQTGCPINGEII